MKRDLFMSIAAVVAVLFGLSFLLMPVQTMTMYGVDLDISGQFIARYLGSAFLGIGIVNWLARSSEDSKALRAVLLGFFIVSLTGLIVAVFDATTGIGNSLVWSTVVIYLLLSAGFGYFSFKT